MASPEPPAETPEPGQESRSTGIPLRTLTAWALLGLAALQVLFEFLEWIFPTAEGLGTARFNVYEFADPWIIVPALLGMLVAFKLGPPLSNARLYSTIALSTFAAAAVFGLVAFFVGLADHFDTAGREGIYAFGFILQSLGGIIDELLWLALVVLAGLWAVKIAGSDTAKLPNVNINTEDE
jgi:hypothetical protein